MSRYEHFCAYLLDIVDGKLDAGEAGDIAALSPKWRDQDEFEEAVCAAVCKLTRITPERWDKLNNSARIPWLEEAIDATHEHRTNISPPVGKLTPLQQAHNWLYARFIEQQKQHNIVGRFSCDGSPERKATDAEKVFAPIRVDVFHRFLSSINADLSVIISACKTQGWISEVWGDFDPKRMTRYYAIQSAITEPWESPEVTDAHGPKGKAKSNRGRKPDPEYDPKRDRRLCEDWKAAKRQGTTREAFARGKGISVNDLIAAQNREKYRRQRDAE